MILIAGMEVVAIDKCNMNEGYPEKPEYTLTIGKSYTVIDEKNGYFGVTDDLGDFHRFGKGNEWDEFFVLPNIFKQYRRTGLSEMRSVTLKDMATDTPGTLVDNTISISKADTEAGSPKIGDMIARNPKDHSDKWLVAKEYFEDNLEPAIKGTNGKTPMNFGYAISELKKGNRVVREGWNGKGMFLILQELTPEIKPYHGSCYAKALVGIRETVSIDAHIDMYTAGGTMQPGWLASQADMLSNDWMVV